jgi:hypothetical protein
MMPEKIYSGLKCIVFILENKSKRKMTMQIKIFEGNGNNEVEINAWLKENPNIKVINITAQCLYDTYLGVAPAVCSSWISTTAIYESSGKKSIGKLGKRQ